MRELSDVHAVPVENLLAPDTVRRLAWAPPGSAAEDEVAQLLRTRGARTWQVELSARLLAGALAADSAVPTR
jgi:ribonuclease D